MMEVLEELIPPLWKSPRIIIIIVIIINEFDLKRYAYSVPSLANRSICGQPLNEPICGRVLGLAFDSQDNLYHF